MKRIILSGLALAMIGITILSCEKEKIEEISSPQSQILIPSTEVIEYSYFLGENFGKIYLNKEKQLPIYLETSTVRNFSFYEKLDFKLISQITDLDYKLNMYLK